MRLRFEQQLKLGITPISEVVLNLKSRHGLIPVLRALKYVFNTKELNEAIFQILEKDYYAHFNQMRQDFDVPGLGPG